LPANYLAAYARERVREGESELGRELVFDYLRLLHMIGDGSLLLTRVGERAKERESMKAKPVMCGDCLIFLSDCVHSADYLQDLMTSAERLIQLIKEREELTK
jgi:hypothetical protein